MTSTTQDVNPENPNVIRSISVALPYITDELWEAFNETCLMTWDAKTNRPHWTQIAVDFASYLKIKIIND